MDDKTTTSTTPATDTKANDPLMDIATQDSPESDGYYDEDLDTSLDDLDLSFLEEDEISTEE